MATTRYARLITQPPPQSQPLPGREQEMHKNQAGGYTFTVNDWTRLDRFLLLGSDDGSYYASARKLTQDNARVVERCVREDGLRTVRRIAEVARKSLAPRPDAGIVALAICAKKGDEAARHLAYATVGEVCRTASQLFQWAEMIQALGGWGHGARRAVARWYLDRDADSLAYQMVKYRTRVGWSHRDLLRLAHPTPPDDLRNALFNWAARPTQSPAHYHPFGGADLPRIIEGFERCQKATTAKAAADLVKEYRLPRECVQPDHLTERVVWGALLEDMPLGAMVRNLGNMGKAALLVPGSSAAKLVVQRLQDQQRLRGSHLHPMALLLAERQYQGGHASERVRDRVATWTPVAQVVDALDAAFYDAMAYVPTTGKRLLLGVDCSGSMHYPMTTAGNMTCTEAAVAMALVTLRTEPQAHVVGFDTALHELAISGRSRLVDAQRAVAAFGGGTNCALPIQYAHRSAETWDGICIYTDSETWYGHEHPTTSLAAYRKAKNPACRMVTAAFTATRSSIADQQDPMTLDCVGLDASLPQVIGNFLAAEF